MTWLWVVGEPILVDSDEVYTPLAFTWRGQRHRVQQVTNRWRLDDAWWQQQIRREYFKVSTQTGLLVVIYLDWTRQEWFLQRLYD